MMVRWRCMGRWWRTRYAVALCFVIVEAGWVTISGVSVHMNIRSKRSNHHLLVLVQPNQYH